jgi:hypothetical protein
MKPWSKFSCDFMVFEHSEKKTLKKCTFFGSFLCTSKEMNKKINSYENREIINPIDLKSFLTLMVNYQLKTIN